MTQTQRGGVRRSPSAPHGRQSQTDPQRTNVAVVSTDVLSGLKPGDNRDTAMHSPRLLASHSPASERVSHDRLL